MDHQKTKARIKRCVFLFLSTISDSNSIREQASEWSSRGSEATRRPWAAISDDAPHIYKLQKYVQLYNVYKNDNIDNS